MESSSLPSTSTRRRSRADDKERVTHAPKAAALRLAGWALLRQGKWEDAVRQFRDLPETPDSLEGLAASPLNSGERMWLLRNRGRNDAWLGIRLKGRRPNTGAVGARVTLRTEAAHQVRWVLAGDSHQSSSDQRFLFVLRSDDPAQEVEVAWPSGTTTRLPFSESMVGKYTEISE